MTKLLNIKGNDTDSVSSESDVSGESKVNSSIYSSSDYSSSSEQESSSESCYVVLIIQVRQNKSLVRSHVM
jgi:hypothetical protein